MTVLIRQAAEEDYQQLCTLFVDLDALHRQALPHLFRKAEGPARAKEFITSRLADENVATYVAENHDGQLVGFVQAELKDTPDIPIIVPRRFVRINDLVVKSQWQRVGIGRQLVDQAQQWAVEKGATEIELGVWEFNQEAAAFYKKLGYTTAKRIMSKSVA